MADTTPPNDATIAQLIQLLPMLGELSAKLSGQQPDRGFIEPLAAVGALQNRHATFAPGQSGRLIFTGGSPFPEHPNPAGTLMAYGGLLTNVLQAAQQVMKRRQQQAKPMTDSQGPMNVPMGAGVPMGPQASDYQSVLDTLTNVMSRRGAGG